MRRATNRRVRIFLWLVLAGALIGAAYGGVVGRVFRETGLIGGSIRAIDGHGGEIYQYVGDEMVVTWPVSAGRTDARPLACFFAIEAAIEAAAGEFEREFGIVPRLRAALHAGPVIGGEIGDSKREIVFHGDVMNTAARLEQATVTWIDRSWCWPRRSAVSTGRSRMHGRPSDPEPSGAGRRRWRSTR